jgi:hypothetical protein
VLSCKDADALSTAMDPAVGGRRAKSPEDTNSRESDAMEAKRLGR